MNFSICVKMIGALGLALALVACAPGKEGGTSEERQLSGEAGSNTLEVIGTWASTWGTDIITESSWNAAAIVEYDNVANTAIIQNPEDDEYNPGQFSKLVWTDIVEDVFYYCTVSYGLETVEEASGSENTADVNDLEGSGCGGFAWTKLVPAIEIHGDWATEWGTESITSFKWNTAMVISYDNATNTAITQNPEDDEYNPAKFSKVTWTEPTAAGEFFFCTVVYGQETLQEAVAAEDTSDPESLEDDGCGGFAWSKVEKVAE
ncbi:MAG: hypothetical protein VX699_01590 [Myxococcota bacterium]|nr:hypothetical protein [Myxococcota bacterium]